MPTEPSVLHVVGAAIVRGGRCLVARRGAGMALAGQWELPGGKVEAGEDPRRALVREIREELGIEIRVGDPLGQGSATHAGREIRLEVYLAELLSGRVKPVEHAEVRWIGPDDIHPLDWAAADRPVLPALERHLRWAGADPSRG